MSIGGGGVQPRGGFSHVCGDATAEGPESVDFEAWRAST